jgi:hypothetical protein
MSFGSNDPLSFVSRSAHFAAGLKDKRALVHTSASEGTFVKRLEENPPDPHHGSAGLVPTPTDSLPRRREQNDLVLTHDVIVLVEFIGRQRMAHRLEIRGQLRKSTRIASGFEVAGFEEIPEKPSLVSGTELMEERLRDGRTGPSRGVFGTVERDKSDHTERNEGKRRRQSRA